MIVNIGLWASPELFGDFGGEGRGYWNPLINGLFTVNGQPHSRTTEVRHSSMITQQEPVVMTQAAQTGRRTAIRAPL